MPPEVVRNPEQWHRLRREQREQTSLEAKAALDAGDLDTTRTRLDDAFAYGLIVEDCWKRLHTYLSQAEADRTPGK